MCVLFFLKNCSALAFILDHLLHNKTADDKETPALARVLIAAIASCNHSIEVQTSLVHEVLLNFYNLHYLFFSILN